VTRRGRLLRASVNRIDEEVNLRDHVRGVEAMIAGAYPRKTYKDGAHPSDRAAEIEEAWRFAHLNKQEGRPLTSAEGRP